MPLRLADTWRGSLGCHTLRCHRLLWLLPLHSYEVSLAEQQEQS